MNTTLFLARAMAIVILLQIVSLSILHGVNGKIITPGGEPIAGATISDGITAVSSAGDGTFSFKTEADSIFVSRIGYHRRALNRRKLPNPIVLVSSDIVLPTVRVKALEYKPITPSIIALVIHPDTNARVESATDLLLENPSFSTTDIKLSGERQTLSLLGSFNRHSLVMLDGVVLNPAGEAFDFSKIPVGQIDYIEIVKGNSSVYGGSAAIGGIIHIHSKSAAARMMPEAKVSAQAGSFGLYRQVYAAAISQRFMALNAEYSHQTAANNFPYNTPAFWNDEPELPRLHNRKTADSFYLKSSVFNQASQLDYSLNAGSFIRQLPGPINFLSLFDASRLTGAYTQHSLRGYTVYNSLAGELLLWHNKDSSTYSNLMSTNPFGANNYKQNQYNSGIKAGSSYSTQSSKLGINAEYSTTEYSFNNYLSGTLSTGERENSALSAVAQKSFYPAYMELKLLAAGRGDYSEQELHPTWRIENEIILPFKHDLRLGGYVGTAFSQPSLFDMYWIGDSETQGNPNLKSESSTGFSLYSVLGIGRIKLKLAYYNNHVDNLIQWRQYYMNGVSWKPFNVGTADIRNYEAETELKFGKYLGFVGSVTLTDAVDKSINPDGSPSPTYAKKLVYTPDAKANAKLSIGGSKLGANLSYSYTGRQYSTVDNLIEPLSAFDLFDAAAYCVLPLPYLDIRLDLKANNLLDKRYYVYAYTPQPGFNWQAGISISTRDFAARDAKPDLGL